jgi:hypothetical protein
MNLPTMYCNVLIKRRESKQSPILYLVEICTSSNIYSLKDECVIVTA